MDTERLEAVVRDVVELVGDRGLAKVFRDFLLLFLNRVQFDDFQEHRLFIKRILESPGVDREAFSLGILLSLCGVASDVRLPLVEVREVLRLLGSEGAEPLPFAIARLDSEGRVVEGNRVFRRMVGERWDFGAIFPSVTLKEGRFTVERYDGVGVELVVKRVDAGFVLLLLDVEEVGREPFNLLLRRLRKERGYTLVALAEELGISRGYLHNIESGRVVPAYGLIERIAALLDADGREGLLLSGVVARIPPECRAHLARLL